MRVAPLFLPLAILTACGLIAFGARVLDAASRGDLPAIAREVTR